ncbi:MAG: hypothetical protein KF702_11175 [Gammaproteobacteria bacterium]|nr:hypothetical protein [Gammaproteobacteria bacterium]
MPSTALSSPKQYRQFYEAYPQIGQTVSGQSGLAKTIIMKHQDVPMLPPEKLIMALSYSHFAELIKIDDPLKRSFYEIESMINNWGSRELRRQISTLYYERLGLSKDKEKIKKMIETGTYADENVG